MSTGRTGSPMKRSGGAIAVSSMCCSMWTLKRFAARTSSAGTSAKRSVAIPRKKTPVRHAGHRRRFIRRTPRA